MTSYQLRAANPAKTRADAVVVGATVGDQIVDDPAGVGQDQGVLSLARADLVQVRAEAAIDEGGRTGPVDRDLAEVTDVEDADRVPDGRMLGQNTGTGVLHRHRPAAEGGELRAQLPMPGVQR